MYELSQWRGIEHFPYRSATVTDRILSMHFGGDDASSVWIQDFRRTLGKVDNHTCWRLERNRQTIYVQFSDWIMYVGLSIVEKTW